MKAYTAARWPSGAPLWNPLSGCGEPWLAQLQTGVFYPGDLPFLLPGAWGPLLGIAIHIVIASSGTAAWLFALGTSRAGALLGAAVFAGGGAFLSLALVYNSLPVGVRRLRDRRSQAARLRARPRAPVTARDRPLVRPRPSRLRV